MNTIRIAPKTVILVVVALIAAGLAGCSGSGTGGQPQAPALSGQSALDAEATLAVWSAQGTAVAVQTQAAVQATAGAAQATNEAAAAAQATSVAFSTGVAVEATGTAAAYQAVATTQAIAAIATSDALTARQWEMGIAATATADAVALRFQQEQAAKALAAKQADLDRQAMWTRLIPPLVLAGVLLFAGVVLIVTGGHTAKKVVQARPQQAGDVWVMVDNNGVPTAINRPPRALPAGEPVRQIAAVSTVPPDAPIPLPEMRHGHVLIAGETGSGKSTAMRAVLRPRRNAVVLDPHSAGNDWGAARVIGAGRDFDAIRDYLEQMSGLLRERYAARAGGRVDFEPLTVAVDEMPAIVGAIGREIETVWREWLREGRKVGLFLVLSTQSTRVRTLGIEGERDLLENFTFVLAMGDVARREYAAVVSNMLRPAALVTRGRARPVVIPQVAEAAPVESIPAGDLDGDGDEDVILLPESRQMLIAPTPTRRPKADPRNMTPDNVALIRSLLAAGWSQRAIEDELFHYTGGAAWEAVLKVMNGEIPAAAYNPAPGNVQYGYP